MSDRRSALRVIVLGATGTWHSRRLQEALSAAGHVAVPVPATRVVVRTGADGVALHGPDGITLHDADAVLVRGLPRGSLEQVVHRLDVLHLLEAAGVPVLNGARAIERTVDKAIASALLRQAGVPTPPAESAERYADAMAAFDRLGGDVVVKPVFGAMGAGIVRVEDRDVAHRLFRVLELERAVAYLQRTVVGERRRDLRVLVLGDEVIATVARTSDHWRANVARGAQVAPTDADPDEAAIARAAARALGAQLAGVDLLRVDDGPPQVLEVNGIPGWQALQRATGIDVAARVVAHLERRHETPAIAAARDLR